MTLESTPTTLDVILSEAKNPDTTYCTAFISALSKSVFVLLIRDNILVQLGVVVVAYDIHAVGVFRES